MLLRLFGCLYCVLRGHGQMEGEKKKSLKNDGSKSGITNVRIEGSGFYCWCVVAPQGNTGVVGS